MTIEQIAKKLNDCANMKCAECEYIDILEIENCRGNIIAEMGEECRKLVAEIRADAIDEFAHALKETFNNEFPSNYHCTQPYFTLDNVRVLVDLVVKE